MPSERNSTQAWLAGFDSKQSGEGPLDYLQTHAHTLEKFFWQDKLTFIDVHFNLSTCVEVNVASNLYFIFSCRKNYGQFSLFNKSLGTSWETCLHWTVSKRLVPSIQRENLGTCAAWLPTEQNVLCQFQSVETIYMYHWNIECGALTLEVDYFVTLAQPCRVCTISSQYLFCICLSCFHQDCWHGMFSNSTHDFCCQLYIDSAVVRAESEVSQGGHILILNNAKYGDELGQLLRMHVWESLTDQIRVISCDFHESCRIYVFAQRVFLFLSPRTIPWQVGRADSEWSGSLEPATQVSEVHTSSNCI